MKRRDGRCGAVVDLVLKLISYQTIGNKTVYVICQREGWRGMAVRREGEAILQSIIFSCWHWCFTVMVHYKRLKFWDVSALPLARQTVGGAERLKDVCLAFCNSDSQTRDTSLRHLSVAYCITDCRLSNIPTALLPIAGRIVKEMNEMPRRL